MLGRLARSTSSRCHPAPFSSLFTPRGFEGNTVVSPRGRLAGDMAQEARVFRANAKFSSVSRALPVLIGISLLVGSLSYHYFKPRSVSWAETVEKSLLSLEQLLDPIAEEAFVRELVSRYPRASDHQIESVLNLRSQRIHRDFLAFREMFREETAKNQYPDFLTTQQINQSLTYRKIPQYRSTFDSNFLSEISDTRLMLRLQQKS